MSGKLGDIVGRGETRGGGAYFFVVFRFLIRIDSPRRARSVSVFDPQKRFLKLYFRNFLHLLQLIFNVTYLANLNF